MGIHVSSAHLANTTSRLGALGVVSAVGLRHFVIEEIRAGDPLGIELARRFPIPTWRDEMLRYAPGGDWHKRTVPLDLPDPERGGLAKRLSTVAAFVEVGRAKHGHYGKVGINVMWKCALTVLPSIYGAMLAGVDALLCGAGVPMELPDIVAKIRAGESLAYDALNGTGTPVAMEIPLAADANPKLLPILSNFAFPKRILDVWERSYGGAKPYAFILENHAAGGHNAPPRDKKAFGDADDIASYFDKVLALGVKVYVAGAFENGGNRCDYIEWRERGAWGLQVGSRFALCDESGMRRDVKDAVIARNNSPEAGVLTDLRLSPTGYPFKVIPLPGSAVDPEVDAARRRICNKGYLMHGETRTLPDGRTELAYVCPSMPARQYEKLGGDPADTEGRICLCNTLMSAAGFDADREPPLITLGASGTHITRRWSAREIIEDILTPPAVAAAERALAG